MYAENDQVKRVVTRRKMQSWRRWALNLMFLSIIAAAIYFCNLGLTKYQAHLAHQKMVAELDQKLLEAIGRDRGYTETLLSIEGDSPSVTFEELFSMCDKSVEQRTELMAELRGFYPQISSQFRNALIDQLKIENEMVRAKKRVYYGMMTIPMTSETYVRYLAIEPERGGWFPAIWESWKQTEVQLWGDVVQAIDETSLAAVEFKTQYNKLCELESGLISIAKEDDFEISPLFNSHKASNFDFAKRCKTEAEGAKTLLKSL